MQGDLPHRENLQKVKKRLLDISLQIIFHELLSKVTFRGCSVENVENEKESKYPQKVKLDIFVVRNFAQFLTLLLHVTIVVVNFEAFCDCVR